MDDKTKAISPSLGIYTNKVSRSAKNAVFELQTQARKLLGKHRIGICKRALSENKTHVDIGRYSDDGKYHYGNLMACDRLWVCPLCANRISINRQLQLEVELDQLWYLHPVMITYTLRHKRGDSLKDLLSLINMCRKKFKQGSGWISLQNKYGWVASVRTLEITFGQNGWHPHIHELALLPNSTDGYFDLMLRDYQLRWQKIVQAQGGDVIADIGLSIITGSKATVKYISKANNLETILSKDWTLAAELTRQVQKKSEKENGITPFELLEKSRKGDKQATKLWLDYARDTKGHRQMYPLSFSKLLKKEEIEIIDLNKLRDNDPDFLLSIPKGDWYKLMLIKKDVRGRILECADRTSDKIRTQNYVNELLKIAEVEYAKRQRTNIPSQSDT